MLSLRFYLSILGIFGLKRVFGLYVIFVILCVYVCWLCVHMYACVYVCQRTTSGIVPQMLSTFFYFLKLGLVCQESASTKIPLVKV